MAYGKKNKTKQHKPTTPQTKHRKGSKGNDLVFKPWVPVWVMTGSAKPSMSPISLQLTESLLDERQRSDVFLLQLGSYCILLFRGTRSRCRSLISSPKWSLFFFFCPFFFSPTHVAAICILSFCSSNTFLLAGYKDILKCRLILWGRRGDWCTSAKSHCFICFKHNEMGSAFTVKAPCCWRDWGRQGPQLLSRAAWMCHRVSERIPM